MDLVVQDTWFSFIRTIDEVEDTSSSHSKIWSVVYQTVSAAVAAVVILSVVFSFCFRGVAVSGASMENTLHDGDLLAVATLPHAQNGDVVIITQPNSLEKTLVKRVIASGGEVVNIDFLTGVVTVNDKVLTEDYISTPTTVPGDIEFPLTVPEGCFFVMGDNRGNSMDSRFSLINCIDEDYVLGVVKFRVFPFSAIQIIR